MVSTVSIDLCYDKIRLDGRDSVDVLGFRVEEQRDLGVFECN